MVLGLGVWVFGFWGVSWVCDRFSAVVLISRACNVSSKCLVVLKLDEPPRPGPA